VLEIELSTQNRAIATSECRGNKLASTYRAQSHSIHRLYVYTTEPHVWLKGQDCGE
jgi:hypothetical protein